MARFFGIDNKYQIIIILIISFFVISVTLAVVFSNVDFEDKVEGTIATIVNDGDLVINYVDGDEISYYGSGEHSYGITITNSSNSKIYYSIYIKEQTNSSVDVILKNSDDEEINSISENLDNGKLLNLEVIGAGETIRYTIVINSSKNVTFKANLEVVNDSLTTETFADLILLNNSIGQPKTRVGSEIATEDEGLLSTIDNDGTSYYFRGNISNNYVKMGDLIFRIVRINGNNSVRLVLNDVLSEQYAYNTNTATDLSGATNLAIFSNSTLLSSLSNWYQSNLSDYNSYIVSGKYCTDTNFDNLINGINYSSTYERIFFDEAPDLYCNGNIYTGNVGLLSVDEVILAGAYEKQANTSYYLYNDKIAGSYITSSSYFINDSFQLAMINIMNDGSIGDGVLSVNTTYVRPVINVDVNAKVKGSGTIDDPYIIVS